MSNSVPRVYLGSPYNREFWWNTALRILNSNHRGEHDHRFTRKQNLPDAAANPHKPSAQLIGGVGAAHVVLKEVLKYKHGGKG